MKPEAEPAVATICEAIRTRLEAGMRVRRKVLDDGRIYLDRLLPFLVLHRRPVARPDPGTEDLATTSAAYLVAAGDRRSHRAVFDLVDAVRALSMSHFGAFLLIEVWSRPPDHAPIAPRDEGPRDPGFRLFGGPEGAPCDVVLEVLRKNLSKIRATGRQAKVDIPDRPRDFPRRPRLLYGRTEPDLLQIGVEVEPSYRDADGTTLFPGVLRALRAGLDRALRHAVFHFSRRETKYRPKNFHSLGRRAMVKTVWEVDERLDRLSSSFDFLLAVTPVNLGPLWTEFRRTKYERLPRMRYPPLPIDPAQAKRDLFAIPMERIEDPTIVELFVEKQEELDRRLTMLRDRGTERFLLGSQLIYGRISQKLVRSAEELLERVPATRRSPPAGRALSPEELVALAEREIAHYRDQWEGVEARVVLKPNVLAGIMVSNGQLLIASNSKIHQHRADALLQHEVGTHLVTFYNGKAQRFAQLKSGLAGYEELQEGLGVLAEYLVSGMTPGRLRILAARVLAAKALLDGAGFIDTFRLLCRYGFQRRAAFQITVRIYRGGGFIKDYIYLRGLAQLLDYLAQGEPLERLFVGKIALDHLHIINELESRGVIRPPRLLPRYLEREASQRRLALLRRGKKLVDLLDDDRAD
jgi:uncharacterized protein (TIGR02421 family)